MFGFIDGNLGLAKTFWLFGVLGTFIIKMILAIMMMMREVNLTLYFIISISYLIVVWIAIWNSANQYQGSKSTVFSAKALVVLSVLMNFAEWSNN